MLHRRAGFTLIELLIAILIIAMIMAAVVPYMQQRGPGYERKQFVAQLNALVQFAWQQAIISHKTHRVLFDFNERKATVERDITRTVAGKKLSFEAIKGVTGTSMTWPSFIVIKQFMIEGFDEMQRFTGGASKTVWFYIIPDGMTQQVTINGIDKEDKVDGKLRQFGLVLNPFMAQFKEYDVFQKQ